MQSKKKIFLTSNNPAKVEAVKIVCSKLFDVFSIKHEDIASGVGDTPFTDDEAILGCYTRINSSEHNLSEHVDYIIALEGLIEKKSFGQFVYGWAVIKEMESSSFFMDVVGKFICQIVLCKRCLPRKDCLMLFLSCIQEQVLMS